MLKKTKKKSNLEILKNIRMNYTRLQNKNTSTKSNSNLFSETYNSLKEIDFPIIIQSNINFSSIFYSFKHELSTINNRFFKLKLSSDKENLIYINNSNEYIIGSLLSDTKYFIISIAFVNYVFILPLFDNIYNNIIFIIYPISNKTNVNDLYNFLYDNKNGNDTLNEVSVYEILIPLMSYNPFKKYKLKVTTGIDINIAKNIVKYVKSENFKTISFDEKEYKSLIFTYFLDLLKERIEYNDNSFKTESFSSDSYINILKNVVLSDEYISLFPYFSKLMNYPSLIVQKIITKTKIKNDIVQLLENQFQYFKVNDIFVDGENNKAIVIDTLIKENIINIGLDLIPFSSFEKFEFINNKSELDSKEYKPDYQDNNKNIRKNHDLRSFFKSNYILLKSNSYIISIINKIRKFLYSLSFKDNENILKTLKETVLNSKILPNEDAFISNLPEINKNNSFFQVENKEFYENHKNCNLFMYNMLLLYNKYLDSLKDERAKKEKIIYDILSIIYYYLSQYKFTSNKDSVYFEYTNKLSNIQSLLKFNEYFTFSFQFYKESILINAMFNYFNLFKSYDFIVKFNFTDNLIIKTLNESLSTIKTENIKKSDILLSKFYVNLDENYKISLIDIYILYVVFYNLYNENKNKDNKYIYFYKLYENDILNKCIYNLIDTLLNINIKSWSDINEIKSTFELYLFQLSEIKSNLSYESIDFPLSIEYFICRIIYYVSKRLSHDYENLFYACCLCKFPFSFLFKNGYFICKIIKNLLLKKTNILKYKDSVKKILKNYILNSNRLNFISSSSYVDLIEILIKSNIIDKNDDNFNNLYNINGLSKIEITELLSIFKLKQSENISQIKLSLSINVIYKESYYELRSQKRVYDNNLTVEDYALEVYYKDKYNGIHGENLILPCLYEIFFYDIIHNNDNYLILNFQPVPFDFFQNNLFYFRNKNLIDNRIETISLLNKDEIIKYIREFFKSENKVLAFTNINSKIHNEKLITTIALAFGSSLLSKIFLLLSKSFQASGFPDLFLWPNEGSILGKIKICEVKSHNDKLSSKQKWWIICLLSIGVEVDLLLVKDRKK